MEQKKYFSTAQNEIDNMDDFDDMITEQIDFTKYMSEEYKKVRSNAMARADTDLRTRAAFTSGRLIFNHNKSTISSRYHSC